MPPEFAPPTPLRAYSGSRGAGKVHPWEETLRFRVQVGDVVDMGGVSKVGIFGVGGFPQKWFSYLGKPLG